MLIESAPQLATVTLTSADVTVEVGGTAETNVVIFGQGSESSRLEEAQWAPTGSSVVVAAEIANEGGSLLEAVVVVKGIEPGWYSMSLYSLGLMPGDKSRIDIAIAPPDSAEAGAYPFELSIRGIANSREGEFSRRAVGQKRWTVPGTLVVEDGRFKVALAGSTLSLEGEGRRARARVWMPSAPSPDRVLDISVEGLEESWVTVSPSTVIVRSEEVARALLVFHPPRDCPDARLGQQNFVAVARDRDGGGVSRTAGVLRVLPFGGRSMESSYLQFLPSIYSSDPMVGRLLLIFESVLKPIEVVIDQMALYFDPELAPEEFVPWLALWVTLTLDEKLPLEQRRRMVKGAMELYRWRGTKRGLKQAVELGTGVRALVVENFDGLRLDREARLGLNAQLGRRYDHSIVVTLVVPEGADVRTLLDVARTIIEEEKPAHLNYLLRAASEK